MERLNFFYILFFLLQAQLLLAQSDDERCIWIKNGVKIFVPDSLSVVPGSLEVKGYIPVEKTFLGVKSLSYSFDEHLVYIEYDGNQEIEKSDSLLICFTVFPINFSEKYFHRSQQAYDTGFFKNTYQELEAEVSSFSEQKESIFDTPEIRKQGSFTRGMSFGNTQDVTVNAALNLQLEGNLTDDVEIEAVFSDQNVPFQPEGNTRQIRDIDRVYLALKHKNAKLEAGDITLTNNENEYLRYNKQVLGAGFSVNNSDTVHKRSFKTEVGLAIAKGKFSSQYLTVDEGVLGPYQILGEDNEQYIIIIAGSEKVYLDEQLMERGLYNDYTIDYNNAEITFTAKNIITQYSRVRIEFEYATQNYSRLITKASHQQQAGNLHFYADFYREGDSKNNPLSFTLNQDTYNVLSAVGDSTSNIFYNVVPDTVSQYDENRILYILKDTLIGEQVYSIYERASEEDSPLFSPSFVYVGEGQGNYVIGSANTNGREYQWIAPTNGIPSGTYEPGSVIAAPDSKQMLSVGSKFQLSKNEYVFAETAFSNRDLNLLSDLHDEDNSGQALKIGYKNKGKPIGYTGDYEWNSEISLEKITKDFNQIDRYRSVTFDRNWGVFTSTQQTGIDDNIAQVSLGITKGKQNSLTYKFGFRKREDWLKGMQNQIDWKQQIKKLGINTSLFQLNTVFEGSKVQWRKILTDINYQLPFAKPGYKFESSEHNFDLTESTVTSNQVGNFTSHTFYVRNLDNSDVTYNISYNHREDDKLSNLDSTSTRAETVSASINRNGRNSQFDVSMYFRSLKTITNTTSYTENTLSGQANWRQKLLRSVILSDLGFSTSTARELKREFVYVKVDDGTGTHTWRDENGNGIQELDEFYLAILADERSYAKFYTPTSEYIQVYASNVSHRLKITPPASWQSKEGFNRMLSKFSITSVLNAAYRTSADAFIERLFPFASSLTEGVLVSKNTSLRTSIFFNRKNPNYGLELQFTKSNSKQLLTGGFEGNDVQELKLDYRHNINSSLTHNFEIGTSEKSSFSDFLLNQNYHLTQYFVKPSVGLQPGRKLKLTLYYYYKLKEAPNTTEEIDYEGTLHELSLAVRSSGLQQQNINASVKASRFSFNGNENSALGYEMLEGLRNGQNFTWQVNFVKKLKNGLQIQASYNGRKSPERNIVHIGNLQVSALF
ncbi:hypothetical protein [Chondrinema litorale]|uniref:hypothetical protein n=1 Tax=Chondrinema litorale TaxID=2994555 RepID=UPI002543BF85|nr:hypothetical protein [Chondrinema litorale]UZR95882.1 hypothetical protein OQ292_08655 [Chondrinema litorale]